MTIIEKIHKNISHDCHFSPEDSCGLYDTIARVIEEKDLIEASEFMKDIHRLEPIKEVKNPPGTFSHPTRIFNL